MRLPNGAAVVLTVATALILQVPASASRATLPADATVWGWSPAPVAGSSAETLRQAILDDDRAQLESPIAGLGSLSRVVGIVKHRLTDVRVQGQRYDAVAFTLTDGSPGVLLVRPPVGIADPPHGPFLATTTDAVYLRRRATRDSVAMQQLPQGARVAVVCAGLGAAYQGRSTVQRMWAHVRVGGLDGYVALDYLIMDQRGRPPVCGR